MISFLWTVGHPRTASHPTSASHHRLYVTILSTCSGDTKLAYNGSCVAMSAHEGSSELKSAQERSSDQNDLF